MAIVGTGQGVKVAGAGGGGVQMWRLSLTGGSNHWTTSEFIVAGSSNVDLLVMIDATDFPVGDTNVYAPYHDGVVMSGQIATGATVAAPLHSSTYGWAWVATGVTPGGHDLALMQNGTDPFA